MILILWLPIPITMQTHYQDHPLLSRLTRWWMLLLEISHEKRFLSLQISNAQNSTATVNYLMNNNGNKEEFKENTRKGELLWYAASYLYRTKQPTFLNQSLVHLINEQLSTRFNKTKTLRLLRLIKRWDHDLLVHVWAKEIRQLDGSELQLNKDK